MLKELFDEIRNSGRPILNGFSSSEDVFDNFTVGKGESESLDIIFAVYDYGNYEGEAAVFYYSRNTGKYHEAYGSHCSCYGLEGQWGAEEICFRELENRLDKGGFPGISLMKGLYSEFKSRQMS